MAGIRRRPKVKRVSLVVASLAFILLGSVTVGVADEPGIVPILCQNAYHPMTGEGSTFDRYAAALADIIRNDTSLNLVPVVVHSLGEFAEYLGYPQTYAGVLSLFEEKIPEQMDTSKFYSRTPEDLEKAIYELFRSGVGLVGMNDVAFCRNLSKTVFPVFANRSTPGQIGIVGGKLQMGHYYLVADPTHPVANGLPEKVFFTDVMMNWCYTTGKGGVEEPPKPAEGEVTFVYKTKVKGSPYKDGMVPAVIAYENGGRSVTLPAFGDTERGGPDDYRAVISDPNFQTLFKNSLKWVAERGKASYQGRLEEFKSRIDASQEEKLRLREEADKWKKKASLRRTTKLAVFTILAIVAIVAVYKLTFKAEVEEE